GGLRGVAPPGKHSEMALPVLAGRDGRRAILAFTSVAALASWRPDARPLPAIADRVWQAAIAEQVPAVVVDVAGPVPVAVEGARLAALAAGQPVPPPHDDPDVRAVVDAVAAADPDIRAVTVAPGTDLTVRLTLGVPPDDAAAVAERAASAIMSALAGRFRRGIEIAVVPVLSARRTKHGC
ncbi:MAG: SseB family protein, partial [Micromonosporaceae bacterium]